MTKRPKGRPLAIDVNARSASRAEPAFIAKPEGAPVYHGFQVLEEVVVDGFQFGKITDFEAEPSQEEDAFIVALALYGRWLTRSLCLRSAHLNRAAGAFGQFRSLMQ